MRKLLVLCVVMLAGCDGGATYAVSESNLRMVVDSVRGNVCYVSNSSGAVSCLPLR